MDAGELDQEIRLYRKQSTRDARGGEIVTWVLATPKPIWAKAEPLRGRELLSLQSIESDITIRFTIYYRTDIDATWRVKWRDQMYEIDGPPIDVKARKEWLELMCKTAQT